MNFKLIVQKKNSIFIFKRPEAGAFQINGAKNTGCSFQQAVTALKHLKDALLKPPGKNRPLS